MDIPPEKEKDLENVYGKGAKMLLKMGLQVEHLENVPLGPQISKPNGRQGLGFLTEDDPAPEKSKKTPQPPPKPGSSRIRDKKKNSKRRGKNSQQDELPSKTADDQVQPSAPYNNDFIEAFGNLGILEDIEENSADDFRTIENSIQLITEYCEKKIQENDEQIRDSSEELKILKKMETDISRRIHSQQNFIEDLEKLQGIINKGADEAMTKDDMEKRLKEYFRVFKALKANEFVWEKLEFYKYIVPLVVPMIKNQIGPNWNPLKHPIRPAQLYVSWNNLLLDKPEEFELILSETYMVPLKKTIRKWDGENPLLVVQIIKIWSPIFSSSLINEIKEEVWPKFNELIARWDPSDQSDSIVTPNWLKLWKKLFDGKFSVAIQKVCDRIEMTLSKWHPTDNWALETIIEWEHILTDRHLNQLVRRVTNVLEEHLKKMKFDSENSDTEAFDAALLWNGFLSTKKVGRLLENSFYPNWFSFVDNWLKGDADFGQVSNWYSFWKNRIPNEMWGVPATPDYFKKVLDLIDCAVEAHKMIASTAALSLKDSSSETKSKEERPKEDKYLLDADKFLDNNPTTFKELLEKKCSDNGIIFFPLGKINSDGKQIYRCKKYIIYLDAGVIYVKRDAWLPISMDELLEI